MLSEDFYKRGEDVFHEEKEQKSKRECETEKEIRR